MPAPVDPTKAIFYPYGTPEEPRYDMVKILTKPASDPWSALLAVRSPLSTERLLQDEVAKAVMEIEPEKWKDRKPLFDRIPPKKRMLLGEERLVPPDLTMEPAVAAAVARRCCRSSEDLYGKKQVLSLDLEGAKVTLPVDRMGESFAFYRHQGEEFLLIRAKRVMTNRGALGPADFIEASSLEEAAEQFSRE